LISEGSDQLKSKTPVSRGLALLIMAASLRPRHVSPTDLSNRNDVLKAKKRKRDSDGATTSNSADITAAETTKSKKKKKKSAHADNPEDFSASDKRTEATASAQNGLNGRTDTDRQTTTEEDSAYPAVAADEAATGLSGSRDPAEEASDRVKSTKDATAKGTKDKRKKARLEDNILEPGATKHSKILSKFERAKAKARGTSKTTDETKKQPPIDADEKEIAVRGLQPLPQPALVPESQDLPSYSSLPTWLAEPYYVSPDLTKDFASMPIDDKTRSSLQSKGFAHAFPIQAAVTNLLSPGPDRHDGDICISAATGSGKTLAYALPLVSGIKYSPVSRLRGLVVVPTRELVRQARDTCELCAAGTGLRIGAAVGSTALREEQQQLMVQNQVYDPVAYRSRSDDPLGPSDWAKFNLGDYLAEVDELQKSLPDHVPQWSPNIDILVCTPGRLVDHIRWTKGFTLEHVEWLVIDEADRLLNESFQEWVETVMPAFELRHDAGKAGSATSFLQRLGKQMSRPKLRKIILSATTERLALAESQARCYERRDEESSKRQPAAGGSRRHNRGSL
jgi:ATP-dependent RNA helicase DDX51/DBP6